MFPLPLPILAFDREVIGIIAFVIWILGMIIRAVKNNQEAAPARPRRELETARTEIETFLEEITGKSPKRPPARPNSPKRPPMAKGKKSKPTEPAAKPESPSRPRVSLTEQHLPTSNLGAGVRSHVSAFMQADRMAAEVQRDVPNRIAQEVAADLGPRELTSTMAPSPKSVPVHPFIRLLRDPQGVRQAIALQEILQKPKGLRRD